VRRKEGWHRHEDGDTYACTPGTSRGDRGSGSSGEDKVTPSTPPSLPKNRRAKLRVQGLLPQVSPGDAGRIFTMALSEMNRFLHRIAAGWIAPDLPVGSRRRRGDGRRGDGVARLNVVNMQRSDG
jgi:hypothetical protein